MLLLGGRFYLINLLLLVVLVSGDNLSFNLDRAGFKNYFVRDDYSAGQILVPNKPDNVQRFLAGFPAGDSGLLMYFVSNGSSLSLKLAEDKIQTVDAQKANSDNYTAVKGTLDLNQDSSLGVTVLGSARAVREYEEALRLHPELNFTVVEHNESKLKLYRKWLNSTHHMNLTLSSASDDGAKVNVVSLPQNQDDQLKCQFTKGKLDFLIELDDQPVGESYGVSDLFIDTDSSDNNGNAKILKKVHDGDFSQAAQELSYLTYKSKFLVGGWRYLSYYGRDDLFSIKMLMQVLKSGPIESVFNSVFERMYLKGTNTDPDTKVEEGDICNQETISDFASFVNIENKHPELGDKKHYGYGLIDNGFLLLPALSSYFLETAQGKDRAKLLLERTRQKPDSAGGQGDNKITYMELLEKNANQVLNKAKPFVENPSLKNLIHFSDAHSSGNWRDSQYGNAYGEIPFDVNVVYVPAALRAISDLCEKSILNKDKFYSQAKKYAEVWESSVDKYFEVSKPVNELYDQVLQYTHWANLSDSLIYSQGPFNGSQPFDDAAKDMVGGGFLKEGNDSSNSNHTFYALALKSSGERLGILHSDIGLKLIYSNNVTESYMEKVADALLPFPLGLTTPIGMVIANPAFSGNPYYFPMLDRNQYHGSVMWGWQMAVMANGLSKQLASCGIESVPTSAAKIDNKPEWCDNKKLISSLLAGLDRLWQGIEGAEDNIFSEVWSYTYTGKDSVHNDTGVTNVQNHDFTVTNVGDLTPGGKQGDPVQLWSYGFLAVQNPRKNSN